VAKKGASFVSHWALIAMLMGVKKCPSCSSENLSSLDASRQGRQHSMAFTIGITKRLE